MGQHAQFHLGRLIDHVHLRVSDLDAVQSMRPRSLAGPDHSLDRTPRGRVDGGRSAWLVRHDATRSSHRRRSQVARDALAAVARRLRTRAPALHG